MRRTPPKPPPVVPSAVERAVAELPAKLDCPVTGRYLVGVSGGRDSMVLLHALRQAGYRRLVVCHLNHQLRGRAASADARFVEKAAVRWKFAVEVGRAEVKLLAERCRISLETAAREARQAFFFEVASRRRCRTLLLAHHADDQVETVLFNLCRGGGAAGIAGMRPSTLWSHSAKKDLLVVRPLLSVRRREVDAFAREHGIAFREDATNTDPAHTRNRVRHELIPLMNEVFGREVGRGIWRAAEIIGAEEEWMRACLQSREEQAASEVSLAYKALATAPVAEQRRLLRAWLKGRGARGVGYDEIERTRTLLDKVNGPAKINLPGDLCVRRRAGLLLVEKAS